MHRKLSLSNGLWRMAAMSFLPCLGSLAIWAVLANMSADRRGQTDHILIALAALMVPVTILLSVLDRHPDGPFRLARQNVFAALSIGVFGYACLLLPDRTGSDSQLMALVIAGAVAGFFAGVPLLPFLRRAWDTQGAILVTAIAALCPHAYWYLNFPLWRHLAIVTSRLARGFLWISGISTSGFEFDVHDNGVRHRVLIASPDFSLQIGPVCDGLEGVALFLFLLSVFVLLDWRLFGRFKYLWELYLLTVPFVLVVNALRIAVLFLYAEWHIRHHNAILATVVTDQVLHSHAGLILYSVAFAIFLPLVYRWAQCPTSSM